jgi:TolB-like protein
LSIFNELKRRNVFKVGIAYVIIAWLVAQLLQLVFESFGTPVWAIKTVLVLLATGLPFALFFAWAFELTPDGIKREHEVDRSQSISVQSGNKLNLMIIIVLVLALSYVAYDKFVLSAEREAAHIESATQTVTEQAVNTDASTESHKSIAVLPFVNMSSDPEQEYFSDGISEELLNVLAKIDSLKVAARTSSFSFKGQNRPVGEIAEVLGVDHILEGSVRKSGSQIRVTAQLIRVNDGFHMWSETYDRELVNIFAIQDEITEAIVSELRIELDVQEQIASSTALFNFDLAVKYGPENATTWAWSAGSLNPLGKTEMAEKAYEKAMALDPLSRVIGTNAAEFQMFIGQYDAALDRIDKTLAFAPDFKFGWQVKGFIHIARNEFDEARAAFRKISEIAGAKRFELKTVDVLEEFVRTGKPGQTPDWLNDPKLIDLYYSSFVLVCAGQYEQALDLVERVSTSNIPYSVAIFLRSVLFQEKMGHIPRYQELVTRLVTVESDTD